jgi:hypothetical protein
MLLEGENFVDPLREAFLFGKGEREEGCSDDVPVYGVEGRGKGPFVVFAEVDSLGLACVQMPDLQGDVVASIDRETLLAGRKGTVGLWSTSARVLVAMASQRMFSWAYQGRSSIARESSWWPKTWEIETSVSNNCRVSTICISRSISEERNLQG